MRHPVIMGYAWRNRPYLLGGMIRQCLWKVCEHTVHWIRKFPLLSHMEHTRFPYIQRTKFTMGRMLISNIDEACVCVCVCMCVWCVRACTCSVCAIITYSINTVRTIPVSSRHLLKVGLQGKVNH